ncbi:tetratricopeptide repeat protein [Streptomyces sp. NPDC001617]
MGHEIPLTAGLRAAVCAMPDDVPLRLHLSKSLLARDRADKAVAAVAAAVRRAPGNVRARALKPPFGNATPESHESRP